MDSPIPGPGSSTRPSLVARLLTEPVPAAAIDLRAREAMRPAWRWLIVLTPVVMIAGLAYVALDLWTQMPPPLTPRHRAEAVCFSLAMPDHVTHARFLPPMRIEPSAARIPGRFAPGTPAALALREVMQIDESMVLSESKRVVGDYEVSVLWLSLPQGPRLGSAISSGGRHWLVLTWMEGADLNVCNFRFAGRGREISLEERTWGDHLLERVLVPANFTAGSLPRVRLRALREGTMPVFGPEPS